MDSALTVQKQPNRGDVPYAVSLQLPPGATVLAATPAPTAHSGATLSFLVTRAAGETITVSYRAP